MFKKVYEIMAIIENFLLYPATTHIECKIKMNIHINDGVSYKLLFVTIQQKHVLLKNNSLHQAILSGKKYPWNPPQPVPTDGMTTVVVIALGSCFSFPTGCRSKDFSLKQHNGLELL